MKSTQVVIFQPVVHSLLGISKIFLKMLQKLTKESKFLVRKLTSFAWSPHIHLKTLRKRFEKTMISITPPVGGSFLCKKIDLPDKQDIRKKCLSKL